MKRKRLLGIGLLSAAMLLTGCLADTAESATDLVPISLTSVVEAQTSPAGRSATRTISTDLQSDQLPSGEPFYVRFSSGVKQLSGDDLTGTTFTANGSGGTSSVTEQPFFARSASSVTLCAYHGKNGGTEQVTEATNKFAVALDQSGDDAYKASDLLYATTSVEKAFPSATAALQFTHKMSKVMVSVTLCAGISSVSAVRIIGGTRAIAIDNPTTTDESTAAYLGAASADPADQLSDAEGKRIILYSGTYNDQNTALECAGLIPPQTITGNFLQVVTSAGTATYSLTSKAFSPGENYIYSIAVSLAAIGVTTDITTWGNSPFYLAANGSSILSASAPYLAEAVDLGIVVDGEKVLWANMNVGATSETDNGLYFMWGDTEGHTATDGFSFAWANYKWNPSGDGETFTRYTGSDYSTLLSEDDAANANWGGNWWMPTRQDVIALQATFNTGDDTDWKWEWQTNYNGVTGCNGWLITYKGITPNTSIFLPAAGYGNKDGVQSQGSYGRYWTSSLNEGGSGIGNARRFFFSSSSATSNIYYRNYGYSVRPVQKKCGGIALENAIVGMLICEHGKAHGATSGALGCGGKKIAIVACTVDGESSTGTSSYSHGLALSMADNSYTNIQWRTSGTGTDLDKQYSSLTSDCLNDLNGLDYTAALVAKGSAFQAAQKCEAYNTECPVPSNCSKWFLPTIGQWNLILHGLTGLSTPLSEETIDGYLRDAINEKLEEFGGESAIFEVSSYWSSTEGSDFSAWHMDFTQGCAHSYNKKNNRRVRAVLAF